MFGVNHYPFPLLEGTNTQFDTTGLAWEFCSSHSKTVVEEEEPVEATSAPTEEPTKKPEVDSDSGEEDEDAAEESSAFTTIPQSFSMALALSLFLLGLLVPCKIKRPCLKTNMKMLRRNLLLSSFSL